LLAVGTFGPNAKPKGCAAPAPLVIFAPALFTLLPTAFTAFMK
jgi:hypothetical protein